MEVAGDRGQPRGEPRVDLDPMRASHETQPRPFEQVLGHIPLPRQAQQEREHRLAKGPVTRDLAPGRNRYRVRAVARYLTGVACGHAARLAAAQFDGTGRGGSVWGLGRAVGRVPARDLAPGSRIAGAPWRFDT